MDKYDWVISSFDREVCDTIKNKIKEYLLDEEELAPLFKEYLEDVYAELETIRKIQE